MDNSEENSIVVESFENTKPLSTAMKKRLARKKEISEAQKEKQDEFQIIENAKELSEFDKLKLKFNEGFEELFNLLDERIKNNKDWEEIKDSFTKCKEHDMEFLDSIEEFIQNKEEQKLNIQNIIHFVSDYYLKMFKKYKNYSKNFDSYKNTCERMYDIYWGSDKSIDIEKKLKIDEIDCTFEILFNIIHGKIFKFYPKVFLSYHTDVPGHWMEENGFNEYSIVLWKYSDNSSCDNTMGLLKCLYNSLITIQDLKYCKIKNQFVNKNEKNIQNTFFSIFENMDINHHETCSVCMENTTIDFPCGHYCCLKCKIQLYKNNKNKISCPCCRKNFAYKWLLTTDFYEKNRKSKYYHEKEMISDNDSDDE